MVRQEVFGIGKPWDLLAGKPGDLSAGIAWLLGILILLACASPIQGQSANRPEDQSPGSSAAGAGYSGPRGFWPFGSGAVSVSNPTPSGVHGAEANSTAKEASSPDQANPAESPRNNAPLDPPHSSPSSSQKKSSTELPTDRGSFSPAVNGISPANAAAGPSQPSRLREGGRISQQKGIFTIAGDRVVFSPVDGTLPKMVVLENLSLQRVIQNLEGNSQQEVWLVTGRVTEFQGANYLFLERATRIDEADLENPPSPLPQP